MTSIRRHVDTAAACMVVSGLSQCFVCRERNPDCRCVHCELQHLGNLSAAGMNHGLGVSK